MNEYFINFFYWYYLVKVRSFFRLTLYRFVFLLNLTNTLPMAKNLFVPMFGDNTGAGKFIGVFIRFWWIGFGTLFSVIMIMPYFLALLILIVLPFLPLVQVARMIL